MEVDMSAAITALIAQGRFDRQFALVREHWASVRRLWIEEMSQALGHLRSDLPEDFMLGVGMPGIASVQPTDDGLFTFAEGGVPAVILPAYDGIPGLLDANPERHVEHLLDLVAFDVENPDRFWRRRADALLLGNAFLEIAGETRAPVPVFKTPMSWLRAGGAGVCILDWDWARDLLLDLELIAEDLELGSSLEDALKPDIFIKEIAA
jgi:hypothetical protein